MTTADQTLPAADVPRPLFGRRTALVASWTLWTISAVLALAGVVFWALADFATPAVVFHRGPGIFLATIVLVITTIKIGLLLTLKRPENPVGWLFQALGLAAAHINFTVGYVTLGTWRMPDLPALEFVGWLASTFSLPVGGFFAIAVMLTFPDGRCMTRGWTRVLWFSAFAAGVMALGAALKPGALVWYPAIYNPLRVDTSFARYAELLSSAGSVLVGVCAAAAAWSLVLRYRHGDRHLRLQLKWVAFAMAILASAAVAFLVGWALHWFEPYSPAGELALASLTLSAALPAVAAAIAISRYRLYDIDLIINRTLVWVPLTAFLGGLYAASVVLFQRLFVAVTGDRSDAAIVISTLILAGAFTPMRKMLEAAVDKRFRTTSAPAADSPAPAAVSSLDEGEQAQLQAIIERVTERVSERVALRLLAESATDGAALASGDRSTGASSVHGSGMVAAGRSEGPPRATARGSRSRRARPSGGASSSGRSQEPVE